MFKRMAAAVALGALMIGCADKPHEYGRERPPVGELDSRDKGLQSKDVVAASDQMAQDLLADRELNASHARWLMVVDRVENRTTDRGWDMDIFLERLRVNLARYGKGRVQLVENKAKLRELQARELDNERDDYGQGAGSRPRPRTQPDYGLYARIMELPNRGTSYYLAEFTVTDMQTGHQVWTNAYEVKAAR